MDKNLLEKLEECPFCGSDIELFELNNDSCYPSSKRPGCSNLKCIFYSGEIDLCDNDEELEEVFRKWNDGLKRKQKERIRNTDGYVLNYHDLQEWCEHCQYFEHVLLTGFNVCKKRLTKGKNPRRVQLNGHCNLFEIKNTNFRPVNDKEKEKRRGCEYCGFRIFSSGCYYAITKDNKIMHRRVGWICDKFKRGKIEVF